MQEKPESEKISKASAYYQARPMLGEYCADCTKFIPQEQDEDRKLVGRCANVSGPISPQGWCQYFVPMEHANGE